MQGEKVKLPRSSYEELCKIIKAYGRIEKPATLDEVNALAGVGKTVVSANNFFLAFTGIIEGGKSKSATILGKKLAHALEHEIPDEIQASWKEVIENSEFLRKMTLAIKIRKTMEESALISHIAYSAGEPKSPSVTTGARTVIDILRESGFVSEAEGKIISTELAAPSAPQGAPPAAGIDFPIPKIEFSKKEMGPGLTLHIELRIDAKPSDLDDLAARLKKFFKEFQEPDV
jgi:hypothetical protein